MKTFCVLSLLLAAFAEGQSTQISYSDQVKVATKATRTGSILPATCKVGDLFLKVDAPLGANLFGCLTANTWVLQGINTGGGGSTVAGGGTVIGSEPVNNFTTGPGILQIFSDTGAQINIATAIDTAVVQTHAQAQSGSDLYCASTGTTAQAYACIILPVLTTYTVGMVLEWVPDVTTAGGTITLSVGGLAAIPVKLEDGISNPTAADVQAGRMISLWFDGTFFRLFASPGHVATGTPRPNCDLTLSGRIWYTPGGMGVKDQVAVCVKNASDAFGWGAIY